jgi:4-hydroxy-2-oxoheptanedioate aldolase
MVETTEAVARIDEIVGVPGVDAIFVGPNDLAISSGFLPDSPVELTEHERLIQLVLDACRRRGVVAGIACGSAGLARRRREAGFRMLALSSDSGLLRAAAQSLLAEVRGHDGHASAAGDRQTRSTASAPAPEAGRPR